MGERDSGGPCRRTMPAYSPCSGPIAWTLCPESSTPRALRTTRAASSGVTSPCVARSHRRSWPMAG
eukprot:9393787-Alexandrium_andersonii.AAC.1